MKVERTYLDIFELEIISNAYIKTNEAAENKISAALKKILKQLPVIVSDYHDRVDSIQLNNCKTYTEGDKKDCIVYDEYTDKKGEKVLRRCYTPAAEIKLKQEIKNLLAEKVSLHARIPQDDLSGLIEKLTDQEKDCFSGLVIPEQPVKKEEE